MTFSVGDHVECKYSIEWQNKHRASDNRKRRILGLRGDKWDSFCGNVAAYMHLDEAYVIVSITETGGLRLRGFAGTVSPKDVELSIKPVYR